MEKGKYNLISDLKTLQGISLFQAIPASMADTVSKELHILLKNINIIKYQLFRSWNDEKVNQKMMEK